MVDSSKPAGVFLGREQSRVKWFSVENKYGYLLSHTDSYSGDIYLCIDGVGGFTPEKDDLYEYDLYEVVFKGKKRKQAFNAVPIEKSTLTPVPKQDTVKLLDWAFMPGWKDPKNEAFVSLKDLADEEDWRCRHNNSGDIDKFGVLKHYLNYTWTRLHNEEKILEKDGLATFNTGLSHRNSDKPIYALFEPNRLYPNPYRQPWYLKSFFVPGQGWKGELLSRRFGKLPAAAKYEHISFDANVDFDYDYDAEHIVLDGIKNDRYPHKFIEEYGGGFCRERYEAAKNDYLEEVAQRVYYDDNALFRKFVNRLSDAIRRALDKARSNDKIVVRQYFPTYNTMNFLLPLSLMDDTKIDAALVVQSTRVHGTLRYRGNTIFTPSMAYSNARLIEKPTSDWLDPEKILKL